MSNYNVHNSEKIQNLQVATRRVRVYPPDGLDILWRVAILAEKGVEIYGPWISSPVPQNEEEFQLGLLKGKRI